MQTPYFSDWVYCWQPCCASPFCLTNHLISQNSSVLVRIYKIERCAGTEVPIRKLYATLPLPPGDGFKNLPGAAEYLRDKIGGFATGSLLSESESSGLCVSSKVQACQTCYSFNQPCAVILGTLHINNSHRKADHPSIFFAISKGIPHLFSVVCLR